MDLNSKIYVAGHRGLVGSAIVRNLQSKGYQNLIFRTHKELDLLDQNAVLEFFQIEQPEYVILAAAKVGGIVANNVYRAQFIYENLQIQNNVIHSAYQAGVKKLLFLGSSCIYPKMAPQPMNEDSLLTGELEYTNEPYAIAKIAGIKMCESYNLQYGTNFIAVMPTNLYGPKDNYDLEKSHVLPALIRKMHLGKMLMEQAWSEIENDLNKRPIEGVSGNDSKDAIRNIISKYGVRIEDSTCKVALWGSGTPKREFLHSDDMADACIYIMQNIDFNHKLLAGEKLDDGKPIVNTHINIGSGKDLAIKELAEMIRDITSFEGVLDWDATKPDGTPRKLQDVSKLTGLGWTEKITLSQGIAEVYKAYCNE